MKRALFIPIFFLGCATSHHTIKGPDGTDHELIKCIEIEECYRGAREVCGGNYDITNSTSKVNTNSDGTTSTVQELLIKCQN